MDYKHWLKFLSTENLIKWETEFIIQGDMRILGHNFLSFSHFIDSTLNWRNTKDGFEYWKAIKRTPEEDLVDYSQEQRRYFYEV